MVYVHSFSPIEQKLAQSLSAIEQLTEFNCHNIHTPESLEHLPAGDTHKTLLYSFQQFEYYRHLETFQHECHIVDLLANYVMAQGYTHIILITYPGAYFNSTNLFLQHKGYIEQKFMHTGIPCTMLNVQAIHEASSNINNLHNLFYDTAEGKYVIPQKSRCIVYSIRLTRLQEIILKSSREHFHGKYDVFDTIYELKTFLMNHSAVERIHRSAPLYLYFKSYLGTYASPTMMELFLMTIVPLYKFRTEKKFGISLDQESDGLYFSFNHDQVSINAAYNTILKDLIPYT